MRGILPSVLFLLGGITGCGDDGAVLSPADLEAPADLSMPDFTPPEDFAPYPDLVPSLGIGKPCPNGNECMDGQMCLGAKIDPGLPTDGYCTKSCVNDPDCGANSFCGPSIGAAGNLCWLRCGANDTCAQPKQVCGRRLGGFTNLVNKACIPGNPAAKDGSPCKNFGDCNRNQACISNRFDFPGGACITIGCAVGDNSTCAPGGMPVCAMVSPTLGACFPTCMVDADCRVNEGYKCVQPPGFPQKVCFVNNPLGANCKAAKDCNGGAPWVCIVDVNVPNGLCTIPGCDIKTDTGCPSNGHCIDVKGTGLCFKNCSGNDDCSMGTTCKPAPSASGPVPICAP